MTDIAKNLKTIHDTITEKAGAFDIAPDAVHLTAVSKRQPAHKLQAALDEGQRLFGENRVQEAMAHWAEHKAAHPDLKLHLIGPLQTNKAGEAVRFFDCIETLDREKLARVLAKEMKAQGRDIPCFIQVNTGEEPQKAGIMPADLPEFIKFCRDLGLTIQGLMCIPPIDEPPALHFAFLRKLALENDLNDLSMGMSGDFEKAIPFTIKGGKTYIRVGTGVFGARES